MVEVELFGVWSCHTRDHTALRRPWVFVLSEAVTAEGPWEEMVFEAQKG